MPPVVRAELADQLLARAEAGGVELLGLHGLLSRVTRAVLERALGEEMTKLRMAMSRAAGGQRRCLCAVVGPADDPAGEVVQDDRAVQLALAVGCSVTSMTHSGSGAGVDTLTIRDGRVSAIRTLIAPRSDA